MEIVEDRQVKIVAYKLIRGASAWWEQLQNQRRREIKHYVKTWSNMKKLLKARFLPRDYEQMLYQKYQPCKQDSRSVADYVEELYMLNAWINL